MLRLVGLVVSIGLADSLNPSTIAPALYLASGDHPRSHVFEFTLAVFLVSLAGGAVVALGPGQLLLAALPHPGHTVRYIFEIVAGVAMLIGAAVLWWHRDRLSSRELPAAKAEGKSSAVLGATITVVELPTAFPYFAVIAAIVGAGLGPARALILLVLFNVCFILPLIGILLTLTFAGSRADQLLGWGRNLLQAHWPAVLSILALVAGLFVTVLGITGLTHTRHRLGRLVGPFRHLLHIR
ncbi:MAG TPA: GAP family protein [Solirubrobacteraceae bacterium]|nr:GAP family protein [Solirubrobacteraceae bacterium]